MKKYTLFLSILILAACNTNEPKVEETQNAKQIEYNILCSKKTPFVEWYFGGGESIIQYYFTQASDPKPVIQTYTRETEANTIMLNEKIGIRIQDSYEIENQGENTVFHIFREASMIGMDGGTSVHDTLETAMHTTSPLEIIRPNGGECHCIPMCYYDEMEIAWTPDLFYISGENPTTNTEIIVIAEWNGLTLTGSTGHESIIGIDIIDNSSYDCVEVLNNALFDGMPDEALVNLWLIRGELLSLTYNNEEITLDDLIEIANNGDPLIISSWMQENPECLYNLQTLSVGCGAVALQPIYLIRNL